MERAAAILSRTLVIGGALVLFGSLFLPWLEHQVVCIQGQTVAAPCPSPRYTAWEAFRLSDVALALVSAAVLIGAGLAAGLRARWPHLGIALLGWLAAVLTIVSAENPAAAPGLGQNVTPHVGYVLALLSSGAIAIGALWAGLAPGRAPPASS